MSIPEQSGDSFDFCVLFRVYFTGKGAPNTSKFLCGYYWHLHGSLFRLTANFFKFMTTNLSLTQLVTWDKPL